MNYYTPYFIVGLGITVDFYIKDSDPDIDQHTLVQNIGYILNFKGPSQRIVYQCNSDTMSKTIYELIALGYELRKQ